MNARQALTVLPSLLLLLCTRSAAVDAVQFYSIDFETSVVELRNLGASTVELDGWQFCTQDSDQILLYSPTDALNGITLEPGASLFVHFANDAPDEPNRINQSDIGTLAGPLSREAYSLAIYFPPVIFADGSTMADLVQWSLNGEDNSTADERSDEAESGGVWTDQNSWIATTPQTARIELDDDSGARLHGPQDYTVASVDLSVRIVSLRIQAPGALAIQWSSQASPENYEFVVESNQDLNNPDGWEQIAIVDQASYEAEVAPQNGRFFRIAAQAR